MRLSVYVLSIFVFFKQKTAYEMRISDWSSDVCSSDLRRLPAHAQRQGIDHQIEAVRAVVEGKIGRIGETRKTDGMVFALQRKLIEQRACLQIGRASGRKAGVSSCRSRWSPDH